MDRASNNYNLVALHATMDFKLVSPPGIMVWLVYLACKAWIKFSGTSNCKNRGVRFSKLPSLQIGKALMVAYTGIKKYLSISSGYFKLPYLLSVVLIGGC